MPCSQEAQNQNFGSGCRINSTACLRVAQRQNIRLGCLEKLKFVNHSLMPVAQHFVESVPGFLSPHVIHPHYPPFTVFYQPFSRRTARSCTCVNRDQNKRYSGLLVLVGVVQDSVGVSVLSYSLRSCFSSDLSSQRWEYSEVFFGSDELRMFVDIGLAASRTSGPKSPRIERHNLHCVLPPLSSLVWGRGSSVCGIKISPKSSTRWGWELNHKQQ
jgi:hypothetical protein